MNYFAEVDTVTDASLALTPELVTSNSESGISNSSQDSSLNTEAKGAFATNSNTTRINAGLNNAQTVNKHQVAEHFSAASGNYDRYAQVQKQIAEVNLDLLQQSIPSSAKQMVDLGCGTGVHTKSIASLSERCLAIDISHGMLCAARSNNSDTKTTLRNAIQYCNGDADNLPLLSNSVDALHSSMALQWCSSPEGAINEIVRALSNNGTAQLAIMLDSSLDELKSAWSVLGLEPRVNQFFGQEQWLQATKLNAQVSIKHQVQSFVEWHPNSLQMLRALKRIGAATKSEAIDGSSKETSQCSEQNGAEAGSSMSKPISKQELKLLDQEMRNACAQGPLSSESTNMGKQSVKGLPLTYQVLFLSIQKTTSEKLSS